MYLHIIPLPKTCAWFITSNSNKLNKSIRVQNLIIYSSMPSCHTAPKLNWNVNGFPSLLFFKAQLLSLNWPSCSLNIPPNFMAVKFRVEMLKKKLSWAKPENTYEKTASLYCIEIVYVYMHADHGS